MCRTICSNNKHITRDEDCDCDETYDEGHICFMCQWEEEDRELKAKMTWENKDGKTVYPYSQPPSQNPKK